VLILAPVIVAPPTRRIGMTAPVLLRESWGRFRPENEEAASVGSVTVWGDFFDPTRKKQPSLGSLSKLYLPFSNISRGLRQFFGGLLSTLVGGEIHSRIRPEAPRAV